MPALQGRPYHAIMTSAPATLPVVTLKIERRSSHPWIFQKMVEKPAARIAAGAVVEMSSTATASGSAAGSTTATRASPCAS